ncbi:LOW QUALITY PROTEIN: uncharacterized protein B0I36DRAFT_376186 [Microdochium trichocladiopsis]|uniref:Spray n=1 Tax=Microdochium trichocladiopsis TaxID=1682393 RepID=A0A9P8XZ73_9PEZI|nr:LOW QUALITY PROTEIN: uncharacterized protein B0I36DRAFT_376186 [Microdochium trichocladiopsis]KAH7026415.1 LOW QUALITY PROTEIN: hypothetical protein B0I36DRAFT_376186 [Microdochium trichocladiopsis]
MDHRYSQTGYTPPAQQPDLRHQVSNLSDNGYQGIRGRESLVSLQSRYGSPPPGIPEEGGAQMNPDGSSWSTPFRRPSARGYAPLGGYSAAPSSSSSQRPLKSFRARAQETIHEDESIDMSLLRAAAPPAETSTTPKLYDPPLAPEAGIPDEPVFDMTSFSGPMSVQDQEFMRSLQQREASGHLTGGIGQAGTVLSQGELLARTPGSIKRSFSSRFGSIHRKPSLAPKAQILRNAGQDEANRRGEVIEVIVEEPSDVDLSSMAGPAGFGNDNHSHSGMPRATTIPVSKTKTELFYPQPNWRPVFMQWYYLLFLIMLSVVLGGCQEILYQASLRKPLMKFKDATEISPLDYFILRFIPTIIAVTYGVLWQNTDFEVRRLEAFYQLSKEGGALAAESINVDYETVYNIMRPFRALQRRHYVVAISSIASLLAISLVPTLTAAAIVLRPDRQVRLTNPTVEKTVVIDMTLSRLLTSLFVVIAVLGLVLLYQISSRKSGLMGDVKGIAGLAAMATVSHIMMDFKDMDTASPKDIHHKLKDRRYVLLNSSLAPDESSTATLQEQDRFRESHLPDNPHPMMMRKEGYIPLMLGIVMFTAFIPVVLFTPASIITDKAPWLVTAFAVCVKLSWGSFDSSLRMMEPYYILSKRHAPARTLTLDYTAMPFAVVAFRALFNRHWIVFLVGWGTVMTEGLTIFATSLATIDGQAFLRLASASEQGDSLDSDKGGFIHEGLSGQETVMSFLITLGCTFFILLYMSIVATVVFVRRRHPFLPRQPNTIASVLAFMHQSKMLYDFVGTAKLSNKGMLRKLESLGKTYGLGWFDGRDGQTHCGVDEEELTGNYKHGINFADGNKPWLTEWQLF